MAIQYITRSSAIAKRPARHSQSVEMLSYYCTNNANRSCAHYVSKKQYTWLLVIS